jgi:hypothetical protein
MFPVMGGKTRKPTNSIAYVINQWVILSDKAVLSRVLILPHYFKVAATHQSVISVGSFMRSRDG